jgi:hypothetical protein
VEPAALKPQDEPTLGSPGRALIGWMSEEEAALTLASHRQDHADNEHFHQQALAAREAVSARPAGID